MTQLPPLFDRETLVAMQEAVSRTHIEEIVVDYAVRLIDATRKNPHLLRGASPRATLSVVAVSKAIAHLRGRDYVTPRDVREVFQKTVAHRLLLTPKAEGSGITPEKILADLVNSVPAPQLR
jgi:MoxR-like ATPase